MFFSGEILLAQASMLRNSSSPGTYFQASFRVQSPWTVMNPDDTSPNREQIIKNDEGIRGKPIPLELRI